MSVHFIGAGPGAPDLLTLRGRDLIASCPVCLYAGSLVPTAILGHCPPDARVINTAALDLDEIMAEIRAADTKGLDVARLHSGDLSVWSAMGEQIRRLKALGIAYTVTPGLPSFAAAAAALGSELTLPGIAQSVVLTRTSLAIHLSIGNVDQVITDLTPGYGADCPVAIVYRASWPDQRVLHATLETLKTRLDPDINRTGLILVGHALAADNFTESCLYATDYDRRYRPQTADSPWASWSHGDD